MRSAAPPTRDEAPTRIAPVTAAAALTATVVDGLIRELASRSGRAGLIAALRHRAAVLAPSGVAFHQIERMALHAAADDIAWGRAPLGQWRAFSGPSRPWEVAARAAIRLRLDSRPEDNLALEDTVALEIARHTVTQAGEAFLAARDRWARLEDAAGLQAVLWDDARISASDETRWRMRAGERGLRRLLAQQPRLAALAPHPPQPLWRRLLNRIGGSDTP